MTLQELNTYSDAKGKGVTSDKQLNCQNMDLQGQTFTKKYFARLDFRNSNFKKSKFFSCDFTKTSLVNVDMQGCTFESCTMHQADMTAANITQATIFKNCTGLKETMHKQKFYASGNPMTPTEQRAIEMRDWKLNNTGFVRNGTKTRFLKIVEAWGKLKGDL